MWRTVVLAIDVTQLTYIVRVKLYTVTFGCLPNEFLRFFTLAFTTFSSKDDFPSDPLDNWDSECIPLVSSHFEIDFHFSAAICETCI